MENMKNENSVNGIENIRKEMKALSESYFMGEFLDGMCDQIKASVVDSDFLCNEVIEKDHELCTHEFLVDKISEIKRYHKRICRNLELYVKLKDAFEEGPIDKKTLITSEFINTIAENCRKYTELNFSVQDKTTEPTYIKVNENFTVFIILMQVRNALIKGAKSVRFIFTADDEFINLTVKFNKPRSQSPFACLEEEPMQNFLYDISNMLAEKMYSEVLPLENGAVIKLPRYNCMEADDSKDKIFYENFYLYTVMLAEFSDYHFFN